MPSKPERDLLFNHALEADDVEYAKELAEPNGYRVVYDPITHDITREPVYLSDEELAEIQERDRRRRRLNSYAIDSHLDRRFPGSLDCVDKRQLDFYE